MVTYSTVTKLSPQDTLERAVAHFSLGLGLTIKERAPCCVTFEGGGGYVRVSAEGGDHTTTVEIESHEWDRHARQFISQIV